MHSTDKDWEYFGRQEPYWGVLSHDRFRSSQLDDSARSDFFQSGTDHIDWVLDTVRRQLDPAFTPGRALDFGCGVGRLTLPLAGRCQSVVGVDVSDSMLEEARSNARQQHIANAEFVKGDDELARVSGRFDLVVSHIVLQHIPGKRGQRIFQRLVELIEDNGVGVLHVTYSKARFDAAPFKAWPRSAAAFSVSPLRDLLAFTAGTAGAVNRRLQSAFKRLIGRAPKMQMNPYVLNPFFHLLQVHGVRAVHVALTDHSGQYGVVLFFQKASGRPCPYRA